jgi:thiamine biosynthesis protein ThiI
MVRIAEALARQEGAAALVTGESLGQVSSQTLYNIAVIEDVAGMPVLRPLIGFDKQEIVDRASSIGTYQVSIQPDQDCCTLFVPRHPVTRSDTETAASLEKQLPVEDLVQEALEGTEKKEFRFPG